MGSDTQAIVELVLRFADAVNQRDVAAFRSVWAPRATWSIGEPTNLHLSGDPADLARHFAGMPERWEVFVQVTHGTLACVDGDRAVATTYLTERGRRRRTGAEHFNRGRYDDELERTPEGWRFSRRTYTYLFFT